MPEGPRRRPRLLGGVLAGALLASLPTTTAAAEPSVARDVDEACSDAPTSAFSDRPPDGAGDAVDCVAHYRVTSGATATAYAPSLTVTRGQMASLVVRTGEVAGITLTEPATDPFRDGDGSVHERAIRRLASSGQKVTTTS